MSYANQKRIQCHKAKIESNFMILSIDEIKNAKKNLSPTAFLIWLDLCSNKDNYIFDFSTAYYEQQWDISTRAAKYSVKELIDKFYLVPRKDSSTFYDFYSVPNEEAIEAMNKLNI
jgi:hypothetical protein